MKIMQLCVGMIATNCYIVYDENTREAAVIDPGDNARSILKAVEQEKLTVKYVMLTHAHFDHIGAMEPLRKEYSIKVYAGEKEKEVLNNPAINLTGMVGAQKSFEADVYLKDGEELTIGDMTFKTIFTPGHTCGSVCYIVDDVMVAGDTLFMGSCGRTDFPTGDWGKMNESLQMLKNLEGDYKVLSGHGPATTLERERKTNMFMR